VATPNPRFQIRLALEDLLAQGVSLLSYDPLAGLRQKDDSIKQVKQAGVEMRKRTRDWADAVVSASQGVFSSPVFTSSSLVAPTGLYPNLEPLRELLEVFKPQEFLDASAPPSTVVYTFDVLHEEIRARCQTHFGTGQYDDAIFNAMKAVESCLRLRVSGGPGDLGMALVNRAMNPNAPLLLFSNVPAEQEAYHALFRGAIGLFKNPLSHRFLDSDNTARTYEILMFASLLMRLLEEAKTRIKQP
jgi:uncharacterized protein (TIGR02391 family)